jgi:gas vesicle protein
MNTTGDNTTFTDQGKDLVNKAAKKMQGGLQGVKSIAEEAGDHLSGTMNNLSSNVGPSIDKVAGKARAVAEQGMEMTDIAIQQVRDTAADISDSLLKYTKRNPGKALLMAAAGGALLATLIMALTPSRD